MPVLTVYGLSSNVSEQILTEFTATLIQTMTCAVKEIKLENDEISCFFIKDLSPYSLGKEIIIFIDGLFDKPERTKEAKDKLADAIVKTTNHYFEEANMIKCIINPFNLTQGFSSLKHGK